MIRKALIGGGVALALAAGAASATSLGDFNDVTLAETTVELQGCEADDVELTVVEQLQPTQPQGAFINEIVVTGLDECQGAITWRLLAEDGKTANSINGTLGAARKFDVPITGATMVLPVYNEFWVPVSDVYGVRLIVSN